MSAELLRGALARRLEELARARELLVACDFDGTLAPIVAVPADARPAPGALDALRALCALERTLVAIVSGRAREDLRSLADFPPEVLLVGSHGAELDRELPAALSTRERELRAHLASALVPIAASGSGLELEEKPAGLALHYRNAPEQIGLRALEAVLSGPARLDGVHVRRGKCVVELAVVDASKARALATLRRRVPSGALFFLGDDLTDEEAFATLAPPDLAIKVGPGDTLAHGRLSDPAAAVRTLAALAALRRAHGPPKQG